MRPWPTIAPHPTGDLSPAAREALAQMKRPRSSNPVPSHPRGDIAASLREALRREAREDAVQADGPLSGELWDELLSLVPLTDRTQTHALATGTLLEWLGQPATALQGPAATTERMMAGAILLADHLGTGWSTSLPQALEQWLAVAGHGARHGQIAIAQPTTSARFTALSAEQLATLAEGLLQHTAHPNGESDRVLTSLAANLPRSTPGLEPLWAEWRHYGPLLPPQPGEDPMVRLWRHASELHPGMLKDGFLMRPDWTEPELDEWFDRVGPRGWEYLMPQAQSPSSRLVTHVRSLLPRPPLRPEARIWDHLSTRDGALWPESHGLVLEVLESLGPDLRHWGARWPRPLLMWLGNPTLRAQLPRRLQRELLLHDHAEVRQMMALTLATDGATGPASGSPAPRPARPLTR